MDSDHRPGFSNLSALFIDTTLTRSPGVSHTRRLIGISASIMVEQGVHVDQFRFVDHDIASGMYPDMSEHGWSQDAWPELSDRVMAADIPVIAGPIWPGNNSSETEKVIEQLTAHSGERNERGQWLHYGKVGGCLITGNEDGSRAGVDNESTNRNTTFMTWNLLHLASLLNAAGGFPAYGHLRRKWDAGSRFDFPNPGYCS